VRRDFVAQFKQTILGPAWFLIQPVLTTITFTIIFGKVAGLSSDGLPKILFYFSGTIIWTLFSQSLLAISDTFISNAYVFGKVYFPRLTVPIAVMISNLMQFVLQFALFILILLYYRFTGVTVNLTYYVLLFPLSLVIVVFFSIGLGLIISSVTTKYRDLRFLLVFGIQLAMYATPVIYPISSIPPDWQFIAALNPVAVAIETFRLGFLGAGSTEFTMLFRALFTSSVFLCVGTLVFQRVEKSFMDTV